MKCVPQHFAMTVLLFLSLLMSSWLQAGMESPVDQRLQSANEAYANGRFDEAIAGYSSMIAEFGFSSELLYNLGNSFAQNNQSGMAILQYLRSLRLSPGDADIQGNLDLVRKNIGLFDEDPTLKEQLFGFFDLNQWSLTALMACVFLTLLLTLNLCFPIKKGLRTASLLLTAILVISCFGAFQQRSVWRSSVVTAPETRLLMSPFESASSIGIIQEGSLILSGKTHGEYNYIHDRKGRSGWIKATTFEPINTSHATYSRADAAQ